MRRSINILANTDWLTVFLYLFLIIFGWMNIYSVNYSPENSLLSMSNKSTNQLIWIIISILMGVIIFLIDSRFYSFIAYPFFGFSMFLLIVVRFMPEINGAHSWIILGPISIQPSEFAKLGVTLALAKYLSGHNVKTLDSKHIVYSLSIMLLPFMLIMLQPDPGSALIFGILLLVLYREGLPGWILLVIALFPMFFIGWFRFSHLILLLIITGMGGVAIFAITKSFKNVFWGLVIIFGIFLIAYILYILKIVKYDIYYLYLISLIISCFIFIIFSIQKKIKEVLFVIVLMLTFIGYLHTIDYAFNNLLKQHHRDRILIMLHEKSDPWGYEYNINQSKIAIGSGGFLGRGYLKGPQTRFKYVPEQETDFIFCTIAEEWGFVGTVLFIGVYVTFLLRLLFIAERQRSKFSRVFAYSVLSILFFHFTINIAMTLGLFPVIGIPLPFFSYGGSSLLAFSVMIFILLRLDSTRKAYLI